MLVFKCDHCGEVIESVYKTNISYRISDVVCADKDARLDCGDLCSKCFNELRSFLKASKTPVESYQEC